MASSVNNCIQAPLTNRCSIRMTCSERTCQGFDYKESVQMLPEINNAMTFLTKTFSLLEQIIHFVMNFSWFLLHVIATNAWGNEKSHIHSCDCWNQTGHYYLIEAAGDKAGAFWFELKKHVANNLFTEAGRTSLMILLKGNGPFAEIGFSYMNDEIFHIAFVPKICSKPPCEDFATMTEDNLENNFINFP